MQKIEIDRGIRQGIAYLSSQQLEDGGFESFSSPSKKPFRGEITYRTTFVPALILAAIAVINSTAAEVLRAKLAAFLNDQAGPHGAYNYWAADTPERHEFPYPDDLDDTFCALIALQADNPSRITEAKLAQAVRLLVATESNVGGPYRTWLVGAEANRKWHDIDLAVNCNIAYFLSVVSNPLPNLERYIDQAISKNNFDSAYYPSAYPVVYYMARGYSGTQKTRLTELVRRLLTTAASAQDCALCLVALSELGDLRASDEPAVKKLLAAQAKDGSWPPAAFCIDPVRNGRAYYHGSPVLATTFAIQTLNAYASRAVWSAPSARRLAVPESPHKKAVLSYARKHTASLSIDLRHGILEALEKVANGSNGAEIIELAPRFSESLRQQHTNQPKQFLTALSLANLYGWVAYTIYDDLIDDEGNPGRLPAAAAAHRNSVLLFSESLANNPSFQPFVQTTFDAIDGANAWELARCRFHLNGQIISVGGLPDYKNLDVLAERSLGHCLAPMAILAAAGHKATRTAFRQTKAAFTHYLIARQLCDDMHDWQEDLRRGHCTYAVRKLLEDIGVSAGEHDLDKLIKLGQRQFWDKTLPALCREAKQHVTEGRLATEKAAVFKPDNILCSLFDKTELTLNETLQKQAAAKRFMAQYRQSETLL